MYIACHFYDPLFAAMKIQCSQQTKHLLDVVGEGRYVLTRRGFIHVKVNWAKITQIINFIQQKLPIKCVTSQGKGEQETYWLDMNVIMPPVSSTLSQRGSTPGRVSPISSLVFTQPQPQPQMKNVL